MRLHELKEEVVKLPFDKKEVDKLKRLFKSPLPIQTAKEELPSIISTSNLDDILNSIADSKDDIRKELFDYINLEYPQLAIKIRKIPFDNDLGIFSTLGRE